MSDTRCADCGRDIASQKLLRRRPDLRATSAPHWGRGLCGTCYWRARDNGTLADWPRRTWTRDDLLDEWTILRGDHTIPQAADRLGISVAAFAQALLRARRDGDPRAVFDWAGVEQARREATA